MTIAAQGSGEVLQVLKPDDDCGAEKQLGAADIETGYSVRDRMEDRGYSGHCAKGVTGNS